MRYRFELPYPPSTNHLFASITRFHQGKRKTFRVKSQEGKQYRETAGKMALAAGVRVMTGSITVNIDVFRPGRSRDLDNCLKAVLDALNGVAWIDDEQVCEIHARRFEAKENPRVELEITNESEDAKAA